MRTFVFAIAALSLFSCEKKASEATEFEPPQIDSVSRTDQNALPEVECFEFVQKKDTVSLALNQSPSRVTGKLRFKNYEKDSSHGSVAGSYSGDTLKLEYEFESEGMKSRREMRFLRSGNSLLMGIGDMKENNGTQSFVRPSEVAFDKNFVLVKTDCR